MNIDDIKLTVMTTMAEATTSSSERHHLMEKIEVLRFDVIMRAKYRRQFVTRLILFTAVCILLSFAVAQATSFLASRLFENQPSSEKQSIIELLPYTGPSIKNSP
jgi:hypothetical protein